MTRDEFIARIRDFNALNVQVIIDKNDDYAASDDPFKNFRAVERHGIPLPYGILVRMEDKMARLGNLLQKEPAVVGEGLLDTALDLANYAVILAVWWDNEKRERAKQEDVVDRGSDRSNGGLLGGTGGAIITFPPPRNNGDS